MAPPHATAGWQTFETTLDETIVRDYLAYLPDFAEFEALDRAFAHAARYLARLDALAVRVEPGSGLTDHATYRAALKQAHGRKAAFWSLVGDRF